MACHRRKVASPAWGMLYTIVAAGLAGLAVAEAFMRGSEFRLIVDGAGALVLFGAMRIWVGVNRARLALGNDSPCCTSRLTVRVIEPAAVVENGADEPELVTEATWRSTAGRVTDGRRGRGGLLAGDAGV